MKITVNDWWEEVIVKFICLWFSKQQQITNIKYSDILKISNKAVLWHEAFGDRKIIK